MVKQNDLTKNRELVSYDVNDDTNHTLAKAASPASRGLPTHHNFYATLSRSMSWKKRFAAISTMYALNT